MKNLLLSLFALGTVLSVQAQNRDAGNDRDRPQTEQERPRIKHVLNRAEFDRLQETVKKTPFADDKKNAFRTVMQGNFMTIEQLQLLTKQFVFNDDKLDWAMMAYPYTIDTKEFYRLRGEFSFISTQEKFDLFLQNMADTEKHGRDRRMMGRDEFADLQTRIKKEPFADGKKNIFKLALQDRFITVAQVNEIIRQLTFDDDKLKWAMLAYDYTADIKNYYQLRDVFTFDSNKKKLDKFLLGE